MVRASYRGTIHKDASLLLGNTGCDGIEPGADHAACIGLLRGERHGAAHALRRQDSHVTYEHQRSLWRAGARFNSNLPQSVFQTLIVRSAGRHNRAAFGCSLSIYLRQRRAGRIDEPADIPDVIAANGHRYQRRIGPNGI
jgi:hypothetical protein